MKYLYTSLKLINQMSKSDVIPLNYNYSKQSFETIYPKFV